MPTSDRICCFVAFFLGSHVVKSCLILASLSSGSLISICSVSNIIPRKDNEAYGPSNFSAARCTVLLNCNFIFPCVILHGTTTILQCILVTCLRGPSLLVSCNVHVSWKCTHGNTRLVEVNVWKYMSHGSTRVEVYAWKVYAWNKRRVYLHIETYLSSLSHYITSTFCWLTNTLSCMVSSVVHI